MIQQSSTETCLTLSELSDISVVLDDRHKPRSRQRQSQQRELNNSSVAHLLSSLQHIEPPSSLPHSHINEQQEEDDSSFQLLIDLARDTNSIRMNKIDCLYSFIEDAIGMVELHSLLRFIKSSSFEINIDEPPLNLYPSILPALITLILLENDI